MVEPQKFFIGLVDFFSILLPGALLTYVLRDALGPQLLGDSYTRLTQTNGWAIFLFSSYLLGHFTFLVGAGLLDSFVYDPVRRGTEGARIRALARGGNPPGRIAIRLAGWLFKPDVDEAVARAEAIKDAHLGPLGAAGAMNAFQWSKVRLKLKHPEALAAVERFEADSKFFRSLVVVLGVVAALGLLSLRWPPVGVQVELTVASLPLLALALWRYADQRAKSTTQAYRYVIDLEASDPDGYRRTPSPTEWATHAGGVVARRAGRETEYLLVTPRRGGEERILPKGHIEGGERPEEAAVREVREEAGVWARIRADLGEVALPVGRGEVRARFFLMEQVGSDRRSDGDRGRTVEWRTLESALERATHDETRALLRKAGRSFG